MEFTHRAPTAESGTTKLAVANTDERPYRALSIEDDPACLALMWAIVRIDGRAAGSLLGQG